MRMNKLIVIRAGQTAWHLGRPTADESRIQGTVSLPLTPAAQESLQTVSDAIERFHPDCIYSSGNESSGITAKALGKLCSLKSKTLPGLHELDCGLWQGLRIREIKNRYARAYRQWRCDPTSIRPPQGESLEQAAARVRNSLQNLLSKNQNKTIVVVAAVMVAALIECLITATPLERIWQIVEKHETIRTFDITQSPEPSDAGVCRQTVRQDEVA